MKLRVLTWNIHKGIGGVDRRYRPARTIEAIRHYAPDVVLLQEVDDGVKRSSFDRQVDRIGDALGLRHRAFARNVKVGKGGYGNATLSRWPIREWTNVDLTLRFKKRRSVLYTRMRVRKGRRSRTLAVFNLHLGLAGYERKRQLKRFLEQHPFAHFDPRTPIVVGGDFNDLWGTLGRRLLEPHGFRRATPRANTYPSFLPARPLDALYVRGDLEVEGGLRSRLKLARDASDHLPLVADLKLPFRRRRRSR